MTSSDPLNTWLCPRLHPGGPLSHEESPLEGYTGFRVLGLQKIPEKSVDQDHPRLWSSRAFAQRVTLETHPSPETKPQMPQCLSPQVSPGASQYIHTEFLSLLSLPATRPSGQPSGAGVLELRPLTLPYLKGNEIGFQITVTGFMKITRCSTR